MLGNMESAFEETPPVIVEEIEPVKEKPKRVKKKPIVDIDKNYGGFIADLLEGAADELTDDGLPVIVERKKTIAEDAISGDYQSDILTMISEMTKELSTAVEKPLPSDQQVIYRDIISEEQNEVFTKRNEEIQNYLDDARETLEEIEESSEEGEKTADNMSEYISALKDLSDLNEKTMNYNIENKDFSTFTEMRDHYKEFIKMVDVRLRRLSSLGGGGSNYGPPSAGGGSGLPNETSQDPLNATIYGSDGLIYTATPETQTILTNPVYKYTGAVLTEIEWSGGEYKQFLYDSNSLLSSTIFYYGNNNTLTVTKTFIYNGQQQLQSVVQT